MRISDWSSDVCSSDLNRGDTYMKSGLSLIALALAFSAPAALHAQDKADDKAKAEKPVADYEPQVRTTKLSVTFGGQRINYAATIGETIIKNKDGVPECAVVTTPKVKKPREPKTN